jgi:hypothetical protein
VEARQAAGSRTSAPVTDAHDQVECARDDIHIQRSTDLADQLAHLSSNLAPEHGFAVLWGKHASILVASMLWHGASVKSLSRPEHT